eukprot:COSAG01_NODE_6922_length_3438_cov_3.977838_1_plen_76_part_00
MKLSPFAGAWAPSGSLALSVYIVATCETHCDLAAGKTAKPIEETDTDKDECCQSGMSPDGAGADNMLHGYFVAAR